MTIEEVIDNAIRDYAVSDDAMRWTPDAPDPDHLREYHVGEIVPSLLPRTWLRQFGPFYFHVYVIINDIIADNDRRIPMSLFVGKARTRRGAERLGAQELAARLAAGEAS